MALSKEYQEICSSIENDANYGVPITEYNLQFVASCKMKPEYKTVALHADDRECDLGRLYKALEVYCPRPSVCFDASDWLVSTTNILVHYDGNVSFHKSSDIKFSKPLTDKSLDQFLGKECLITYNAKGLIGFRA